MDDIEKIFNNQLWEKNLSQASSDDDLMAQLVLLDADIKTSMNIK